MKCLVISTLTLLSPALSFTAPKPLIRAAKTHHHPRTPTFMRLVEPKGSDSFSAIIEEDSPSIKQMRGLPTPLRKAFR